ncbi:hypothetical protein [Chitiniphilus eburneus]|uniref:hypothetical protein n=1 Tax=Chitiniphilus eburneus TaxID=2571148 RepID=UPI0035D0FD08
MDEHQQIGGPDPLAMVEMQAVQIDADIAGNYAPPPAAEGAADALPLSAVEEAREVVIFVRELAAPVYPSLRQVYSDETVERIATAAAPLMQKYGVTLGGMFERWGPEIHFAMVMLPVGMQTAAAIRADRAAARAANEKEGRPDAAEDARVA